MSFRIGKQIVIVPEPASKCQGCGKMAECRPYGPGGKFVCVECGLKTPEIWKHNMAVQLFGEDGELR